MDSERFDALASEFYRETGMLPPGKDDPRDDHTREERHDAWVAWLNERMDRRPTPTDSAVRTEPAP